MEEESDPHKGIVLKKKDCKIKAFKYYRKETKKTTKRYIKANPYAFNTKFCLLQDMDEKIKHIFELSDFYDKNFTGNKDFIHIPSKKQIIKNIIENPIILAIQQNGLKPKIVGVTTIKIERNHNIKANPIFPTKDETILTITGVLTKHNIMDVKGKKLRGIGKELYKTAIKGAYELNKKEKVRLICEIDCRNKNSINAISKAVTELKKDKNIDIFIEGYYEIIDENGHFTEAPTFIIEVDLNGERNIDNSNKLFSYINCSYLDLYSDLSKTIKTNIIEIGRQDSVKGEYKICYHQINPINLLNVEFDVGNTALGNTRTKKITNKEKRMKYEVGKV